MRNILEQLKQDLNSIVTLDNLLNEDVIALSQKLDIEIVKYMRKVGVIN